MRSINGGFYIGLAAIAFLGYRYITRGADAISQAAGSALSDVTAHLNGWSPVEIQPLIISPRYLNTDYTLHKNAQRVLSNVTVYQPILRKLFGDHYNQSMPVRYRGLVGKRLVLENNTINVVN